MRAASPEEFSTPTPELTENGPAVEAQPCSSKTRLLDQPTPSIQYSAASLRIIDANEAALQLYAYPAEQMRSLKVSDLFWPENRSSESGLAEILQKPLNAIGPVAHRMATGRRLIVRLVVFQSGAGEASDERIAVIQDETGPHNAHEALRASEERLRELFENANDVIFLHDLKGRILAINRVGEQLTGYSRDEVLGESFERLMAPEARHQMQDTIRAHLGGSTTQHYELPILSRFGVRRSLEVSTRVLYRRGQAVAIQGIARDITERKMAQQRLLESALELRRKNEELSKALRQAQEATQLKEQFLANTSHELRTPMNGIMGMINLLRNTELTTDQREYAETVSQCANDLLTIINDILDLSQIEAGRLSIANEPFDAHESLKNVVKLLRPRSLAKGLALSYDIDPLLPRSIYGDCVRFRQILTNLIANAIKFTHAGEVRIRLIMAQDRPRLRGEVRDTGIGVIESARDRIFEAFVQGDGTMRRGFGGTGLGLAICKQLVQIMGGQIGMFDNRPDRGSTFWFELPLRASEAAAVESNFAAVAPELP